MLERLYQARHGGAYLYDWGVGVGYGDGDRDGDTALSSLCSMTLSLCLSLSLTEQCCITDYTADYRVNYSTALWFHTGRICLSHLA